MKREKIIIVDRNDNIICAKFRDEVDYYNDIRCSSGIWVTNYNDEVLIARRALTKRIDPGKWGPAVQGSIGVDESYEENAYKEIKEELGIKNAVLVKGNKQYVAYPMKYFSQWFLFKTDYKIENFKIPKNEVEEIKWINKNDLIKDIRLNPNNYVPCMDEIFNFLEGK